MFSRLAATVVGHLSNRSALDFDHPVTDREREYLRAASDARGVAPQFSLHR